MSTLLHERDARTIARDYALVVAGITDGYVRTVRTVGDKVVSLRDRDARRELPNEAREQLVEAEQHATEIWDGRAKAGAEAIQRLRDDERISRVEETFAPVGDQAKIARSQVKGAVTSMRNTVDAALGAGREQADTARSQVKGAVTSSRRTVETAFAVGRRAAS